MNGAIQLGEYVRTVEGVGFVFEDTGNGRYQVSLVDRDCELDRSAVELTAWQPTCGERVVEADNENGVTGVVVRADGKGKSVVKWKCFAKTQSWLNTDLEPVWGYKFPFAR